MEGGINEAQFLVPQEHVEQAVQVLESPASADEQF
jgi:hypothetical protein